jgi:hypothetical protein
MTVPSLDAAEATDTFRFGVDVDTAISNHGGKPGEASKTMGIYAVTCGLGKEASTEGGAILPEAEASHGSAQGLVEIIKGDSQHEISLGQSAFVSKRRAKERDCWGK